MDRKIVKAALDGGRIWSPDHGRFLPAEGIEVQMTPYWLGLASRNDITASDLPAPETPTPAAVDKLDAKA